MPAEGNRHEYIFLLSDTNPPKLIEHIHPGLDKTTEGDDSKGLRYNTRDNSHRIGQGNTCAQCAMLLATKARDGNDLKIRDLHGRFAGQRLVGRKGIPKAARLIASIRLSLQILKRDPCSPCHSVGTSPKSTWSIASQGTNGSSCIDHGRRVVFSVDMRKSPSALLLSAPVRTC